MTDKKTEAVPQGLNLYQKLAAITGEIGAVAKDGNNTEQNFKFIEYAAVAGKLRMLFAKYGVVVVPRMQQTSKQSREEITSKYGKKGQYVLIDMSFTVLNADKPEEKFTVTWTGEAADYGDKATNKAATGALKYYLMRQFNISEKGEDADADSHEITEKKPANKPAPATPPANANALTGNQLKMIMALFGELGIKEREDRLRYITEASGVTISSTNDLTKDVAQKVIDKLQSDIASLSTPPEEDIVEGDLDSLINGAEA